MSWLRYDDRFTGDTSWDGVSYAARWHYVALVELCGATGRYDGRLPATLALRASDVPDPDECLRELAGAGKLTTDDGTVTVVTVHDHIPPPSVRDAKEGTKVRTRRWRAHTSGDHSQCLPEHCPDAVTRVVTRHTGTGRDGTGLQTKDSLDQKESHVRTHVGAREVPAHKDGFSYDEWET